MVYQEIRKGLRHPQPSAGHRAPPKTKPHHFGFRPGIDLDKLNQLVDELEAKAFLARYDKEIEAEQGRDRYHATFPDS